MPRKVFKVSNFHGGLDETSSKVDLKQGFFPVLTDVMVSKLGQIVPMGDFDNTPTNNFIRDVGPPSGGAMSDLLTSAQKTFFGDLLDDDDDLFDFNGNNGDGTATLVDSPDGFTATNCTFAMTGNIGRLTNNSSNQGIVTLPIATVAGRTYQVFFEVSGGNSNCNVSLGTSAAYNSAYAAANQDDGAGKSLATTYIANDATSFLALQCEW